MSKKAIVARDTPPPVGAYSPALAVGEWLLLSGQGGIDPGTGKPVHGLEAQIEQIFRNVDALLAEAGLGRNDIVSCVAHLSDLANFQRFNTVYARQFTEPLPVRTTVGAQLLDGLLVELTMVAHTGATVPPGS